MTDPDTFQRVVLDVERAGGALLPDSCDPIIVKVMTGKGTNAFITTCGCRKMHRVVLPYQKHDGGAGFLTACVECDSIDRWPKFQQKEPDDLIGA